MLGFTRHAGKWTNRRSTDSQKARNQDVIDRSSGCPRRTSPRRLISPELQKYQWSSLHGAELHRVILEASLGLPAKHSDSLALFSQSVFDWDWFLNLVGSSGLARGMGQLIQERAVLDYCPESFPGKMKQLANGEGVKLALCRVVLREICESLSHLGTDAVLLKGAALTLQSWESGEKIPAKTPGDIDLLVSEERALALRDRLLLHGYSGVPQSQLYPGKNHLELLEKDGLGIEIHTHIADENWLGTLPEPEMLATSREVTGWEPLRILGPEAFLLHTSMHLARHYFTFGLKTTWGQRFVLESGEPIHWERLLDWSKQLRDKRRFWIVFQVFGEDLDFPFPIEFLNEAPHDRRQRVLKNYARARLHLIDYSDPFFRKHRWLYESLVRDSWNGWVEGVTRFPRAWREHRQRMRERNWLR